MRVIFKTTKKQAANWIFFSIVLFFSFFSATPSKKGSPFSRKKSLDPNAYFTRTVTFTDLEPDLIVIFAVPFFFPVTTPLAETVATFLFELV